MICLHCHKSFDGKGMVCPACAEAKAKVEQQTPEPEISADPVKVRTPRPASVQIVPASLMLRFLAYSIDKAILQISTGVLFFVFFGATMPLIVGQSTLNNVAPPRWPAMFGLLGLIFVILLLSPLVIYALFEQSRWQGTPGKIFMRLVVTDIDGERLTFSRALFRNVLRFIGLVPMIVGAGVYLLTRSAMEVLGLVILGVLLSWAVYLWAFFNPERQGLHDRISGCLVQERGVAPMWRVLAATFLIVALVLCGLFARSLDKQEKISGPTVSSYRSIGPISK